MSEKQIDGGAGPALAAHSKDASVPSHDPKSSMTGGKPHAASASGLTGAVTNVASQARDRFTAPGGGAEQVGDYVRENPITALLATGLAGLILGGIIARR